MKIRRVTVLLGIAGLLSTATGAVLKTFQTCHYQSQEIRERGGSSNGVKTVKVTAETLSKSGAQQSYVVDLATGGSIYEFDYSDGPLDFKRLTVSSTEGRQPFLPWLEKKFSKQLLARLRTETLTVGSITDFRKYWGLPPEGTASTAAPGFTCDSNYCDCSGIEDCRDMIHTNVCGGDFFACTRRGGPVRCICSRR
jgi:hypothetical protein